MKNKIIQFFSGEFFTNPLVHWLLIALTFLNLAHWGLVGFFVRPVEYPIFLHYNVSLGADRNFIGDWRDLLFFPGGVTIFFAVNIILAYKMFSNKERIASYMILLGSAMLGVTGIIASVAAIIMNY